MLLQLQERRETRVTRAIWERLVQDAGFWQLIESKRLRIVQRGLNEIYLAGTSYVGRAVVGGISLEIGPKIPGALEALLVHATGAAFRIERAPTHASDPGSLVALLAREFVDSVEAYVGLGREWKYQQLQASGPLGGGRLDIPRTMRLRSRGAPHLLAFRRDVQTYDIPKNRVVAAALAQVEDLSGLALLGSDHLARARGLSVLFEDVAPADVVLGDRGRFTELAQSLIEESESVEERDLLSLAAVLLAREGIEPTPTRETLVPRTWFLSLERLFERAIRSLTRREIRAGLRLMRGEDIARPIFEYSSGYTANPDMVFLNQGSVLAVADLKYKDLEAGPAAADLYQLLAHAAAFRAPACFLIYPGAECQVHALGNSATGCRTWVTQVDMKNLTSSIRTVLAAVEPTLLRTAAVSPSGAGTSEAGSQLQAAMALQ